MSISINPDVAIFLIRTFLIYVGLSFGTGTLIYGIAKMCGDNYKLSMCLSNSFKIWGCVYITTLVIVGACVLDFTRLFQ